MKKKKEEKGGAELSAGRHQQRHCKKGWVYAGPTEPARHTESAWHTAQARHTEPPRHTELARHVAPAQHAEPPRHTESARHTAQARHAELSHLKRAQQVDKALQLPSSRLRDLQTSDRRGSCAPSSSSSIPSHFLAREPQLPKYARRRRTGVGGEAAFCAGVLVDYLRVTITEGASLERPQKLQHSLNIRHGASAREAGSRLQGRPGGLPSAGQTCAFSDAWDNPGPLGLGTVTVLTWPPQCS